MRLPIDNGKIDGRGYNVDARELQVGDRVTFATYDDQGIVTINLRGTVTRLFKNTFQVNGKPVKGLGLAHAKILTESSDKRAAFFGFSYTEY